MATFPTALDSFTFPGAGDSLSTTNVLHHLQHCSANSAISALEYVVGINGSTTATTLQYKVSALSASASAVGPFTAQAVYDAGHQHSNLSLSSLAVSKLIPGGFRLTGTGITANGTASTAYDFYCTSGTVTAMLYGNAGSGRLLWFKNLSGTAVISASGSNTIDGVATAQLTAQYQSLILLEGASGAWYVF
jgi:hypothetical protein